MRALLVSLALLLAFSATDSYAGFGGSRSGGFSSGRSGGFSSGRSSFGGARSGSAMRSSPAPIIRPSVPRSSGGLSGGSIPHTTIIQNHSSPGHGFFSGYLWGSMMNRPAVVVAGQPGYVDGGQVVVQQSHGFFYYLFFTLFWLLVIWLVVGFVVAVIE